MRKRGTYNEVALNELESLISPVGTEDDEDRTDRSHPFQDSLHDEGLANQVQCVTRRARGESFDVHAVPRIKARKL